MPFTPLTTKKTNFTPINNPLDGFANASPSKPHAGTYIADAFKGGIDQVKEGFKQQQEGGIRGLEGGLKTGAGIVNTILSPLAPFFAPVSEQIDKVANAVSDFPIVQKFANSNAGKTTARITEDVGNIDTLAGAAALIDPTIKTVKDIKTGISTNLAEKNAVSSQAKIQETISPKPTVKEARLAQSEGRLVKGKEPGIFTKGTEDTITPSNKVTKATETIQRNIPGAEKMNESQLHSALDSKITETAQKLKPEMKATPVDKNVTGQALSEWETLKKSQAGDAEFVDNQAGNTKIQEQFESRVKKLADAETLDDAWEIAKEYDNSVPENVKKANSLSDAKLQYRKQMWLDNRAIIRSIVEDSGKNSQAFSDMHNMYNAKEGILSKTKVEKGQISKFNKLVKDHPVISTILGVKSAEELLKLFGIEIPHLGD